MASEKKRKRGLAEVDSPRNTKSIKTPEILPSNSKGEKRAQDVSSKKSEKRTQVEILKQNDEPTNGVLPSESPKTQVAKNGTAEPERQDGQANEVKRKEKKEKRTPKGERLATRPEWRLSEAAGGRTMNIDPVFAGTEYLILAHRLSLQVYSTSTSLLVRSIPLAVNKTSQTKARIVAYCLSPSNPAFCWVACSDGAVFRVEWATGAGATELWITASTGAEYMTVASMESMGRKRDVVFTTEKRKEGGGYRISAHELNRPTSTAKTIFTVGQRIHYMKTVANGEIIVAAAEKKVLIGTLRSSDFDAIDKIKYEFRTFELSDHIASIDARVETKKNKSIPAGKSRSTSNLLHVVVGDVRGVVYVYDDLMGNLMRLSGQVGKQGGPSILPRKLHWHRKAVRSVKWSLDGNYLISGGSETVLVLWQLETGNKQFLPHLTAAIQNVVISPRGNSYAIHLADNSTMVLSTSELTPTANFAGIQAPVIESTKHWDSYVERIDNPKSSAIFLNHTPAVISPSDPSRLLLAVGESQEIGPDTSAIESSPFLQTFDISRSRNIARQALTRTNITNKNIGPEGPQLIEPKTTHMQISFDGSWLATVDEWHPPNRDFDRLTEDSASAELFGREVYLKFWQWNTEDQEWELVSRVDAPHTTRNGYSAGRVLDLAADPSGLKFSTIGEDGVVRVWCPKTRKRDNVIVRGKDGKPLRSWSCRHVVALRVDEIDAEAVFEDSFKDTLEPTACLAYSGDGSLLAVALSGVETGVVHLINPETGSAHSSRPGHFGGDIVRMAILDQYLVTLSDELRVYDLVNEQLSYGLVASRTMRSLSTKQKQAMVHLATDRNHHTFAIAIPRMRHSAEDEKQPASSYWDGSSDISVFNPADPNPLYTKDLPTMITTLLPTTSSAGYIVLDTFAEIRTLAPKTTQAVIPSQKRASEAQLEEVATEELPVTDIMVLAQEEDTIEEERIVPAVQDVEDDDEYPVVTQQQLTNLFDIGPAFALPPIEEMFYQVADLFGSKPLPQAVA